MDPDYDILFGTEGETPEDSKNDHFLDSLGLGGAVSVGKEATATRESESEDGLVLSSMPDDLGFPASKAPSRGWDGRSISPDSGRELENQNISLPLDEEETVPAPEPQPQVARESEPAILASDPEENLHLHCPSCQGELILKRRHVGIEGQCVWCRIDIVAAESIVDRSVRVIAIHPPASDEVTPIAEGGLNSPAVLPESPESAPLPDPKAAISLEANSVPAATRETKVDVSFGGASLWSAPVAETQPDAGPEATSAPAMPLDGPAFSLPEIPVAASSSTGLPAPQPYADADPAKTPKTEAPASITDLDALYNMGGFLPPEAVLGAASNSGESQPPFAPIETAAGSGLEATPMTGDSGGFGSFLVGQDSAALTQPGESNDGGFAGPVPWGAPTKAPAWTSTPTPESAPDFPGAGGPARQDEAPQTLPDGFADGFSAPPAKLEQPVVADAWEISPSPSPPETFSKGSGIAFEASPLEEADRCFAPPLHAFSTGSSEDIKPQGFRSGFLSEKSPGTTSWDLPSDEPPSLFAETSPESEAAVKPRPTGTTGATSDAAPRPLFGEPQSFPKSPFASFVEAVESVEPPKEGITAPAPVAAVAMPALAPATGNDAAVRPQVVSQPLGAKEKPKVRKGFLVLMVILVGFASGAALASFVLPVDEYVETARAYMERKFNPGAATSPQPVTAVEQPSAAVSGGLQP